MTLSSLELSLAADIEEYIVRRLRGKCLSNEAIVLVMFTIARELMKVEIPPATTSAQEMKGAR